MSRAVLEFTQLGDNMRFHMQHTMLSSILAITGCVVLLEFSSAKTITADHGYSDKSPAFADYGHISFWVSSAVYRESAHIIDITICYTLSSSAEEYKRANVDYILKNIPTECYSFRIFDVHAAEWMEWKDLNEKTPTSPVDDANASNNSPNSTQDELPTTIKYSPIFLSRVRLGNNYELRSLHVSIPVPPDLDLWEMLGQVKLNETTIAFIDKYSILLTGLNPGFRSLKLIDSSAIITIEP